MKRFSRKTAAFIFCLFLTLVLLGSTGFAQTDKEVAGKGACQADVVKFCKGIEQGEGRIWACLKSNEPQLSEGCKNRMAQLREKAKEFIQACKADKDKFCTEIKPGKGEIIKCLKGHETELSDPCKAYFQKK